MAGVTIDATRLLWRMDIIPDTAIAVYKRDQGAGS